MSQLISYIASPLRKVEDSNSATGSDGTKKAPTFKPEWSEDVSKFNTLKIDYSFFLYKDQQSSSVYYICHAVV
jgi:hypothetical protein